MITYNQYHQLCVRQRLLAVTCLSWRDFLRKQDLFHYADAASLPFWCHYRHLGPPIIHWLHLFIWFCCFITLFLSSCFSASSSFHRVQIQIFSLFIFLFLLFLSLSGLSSALNFRNWENIFNLAYISRYDTENIDSSLQIPETRLFSY